MKYLISNIIRFYWYAVPPEKRRKCIFHESCSKYVFRIIQEQGIERGLKAFHFRLRNCNANFDVFRDEITGEKKMILSSGEFVKANDIAERLK